MNQFKLAISGFMCFLLSGCMAVPLAGMAIGGAGIAMGVGGVYNAANPNKEVTVTIPPDSLESLRRGMTRINHIAILGSSETAVAFSDAWEGSGKQASIISNETNPASVSLSQARRMMVNSCKGGVNASAYGRPRDTKLNRWGVLIGRIGATIELDLYLYNCRAKTFTSTPITIEFIANGADPGSVERAVGRSLALELLQLSA